MRELNQNEKSIVVGGIDAGNGNSNSNHSGNGNGSSGGNGGSCNGGNGDNVVLAYGVVPFKCYEVKLFPVKELTCEILK